MCTKTTTGPITPNFNKNLETDCVLEIHILAENAGWFVCNI
jgi:hypothetical protein